jgi:hypothetical protein
MPLLNREEVAMTCWNNANRPINGSDRRITFS